MTNRSHAISSPRSTRPPTYRNYSFPKNGELPTRRLVLYLEPKATENLWNSLKLEFLRGQQGVRKVYRSTADGHYHVLCTDVGSAKRAKRRLDGCRFRNHAVRIGYSPVGLFVHNRSKYRTYSVFSAVLESAL
jgi:hypothetical protein